MSACMCGTRGSCVLSSTGDVLEISVVRGVGGVCDMCMCLARGGVGGEGGEWMRELGLGFTKLVGYIRSSRTSNRTDRHERPPLKPCCVLFRWLCLFKQVTTYFVIVRSKTLIMVEVSDNYL